MNNQSVFSAASTRFTFLFLLLGLVQVGTIVLARFVSVMVFFFAFIFAGGFIAEQCAKRFIFRG